MMSELMPKAFICAPYRAATINETARNIAVARRIAEEAWLRGYNVYCPHLNSAFMDGLVSDETFLNAAKEMLLICQIVLIAPGWVESAGCVDEIKLADEHKIEKRFVFITDNKVYFEYDLWRELKL